VKNPNAASSSSRVERPSGTVPVAFDETIVAIATPPGKGAVAIVRLSGPAVKELVAASVPLATPLEPRYATYATIVDERGEAIDRGLALFFPAPHSYTGEDLLELQVHGSPVVAREIVRSLLARGARQAEPGEFTRRAFLNGKMGLHEAQAVAEVIDAETRSAARAALANLGGGLTGRIEGLRASLATILEELAGAIDFPEEVPEPDTARLDAALAAIAGDLERLRYDGEIGRLVREGVNVAIVGPPNAGKSSLLNALLGEDRAIVSDSAGTTRDTIEESIGIQGVPVRLIDTAGIRAHADRLEAAGIERTQRALEAARIVLVVVDGSRSPSPETLAVLERTRDRERIVFLNKADAGTGGVDEILRSAGGIGTMIAGSVRYAPTIARLQSAVARIGWGGELPDLERPHLVSLREFAAVNEALAALSRARTTLAAGEPSDFIAGELQITFSALGHVSERVAAEEVLDGVFSRFCIGK
jgi:tRNA modification GTPase